jgi:hypothetical protein
MVKHTKIYVDPKFHTMLKIEAARENKSIIELTREIAIKRKSLIEQDEEIKVDKRKPFSFRI